jgi:hypothetical protein
MEKISHFLFECFSCFANPEWLRALLRAEQWRCTRSGVQSGATLGSAPEHLENSVTGNFLAL